MPAGFPCPNPTCSHVFPAEGVKGASALKCPRCGNVFQFAKQAARKAPPAVPPPPPVPPPAPPRAAPALPVAPPAAPPVVSALAFDDEPAGPRGRKRPVKRRGVLLGVVLFSFLAAFIGGAIYFAVVIAPTMMDSEGRRQKTQANFSFKTTTAWKADDKLRRQIDAGVALTRSNPRAHMALAFKDYKTRQPSDEELLDDAVKKLKAVFPRLEYVDPIQAGKGKAGELDVEPTYKLEFKASAADAVPMVGECLVVARRGYGYWWITWGPEEDADDLPELWERLRAGFQFGNDREGWQPTPRPTTVAAVEPLDVQLSYVHDVWKPADNPKDYDPATEFALRGFERTGLKADEYAGRAATVQVMALPKAADLKAAVAAAQDAVTKQQERLDPGAKLEPYVDSAGKAVTSPDVGAFKGETRQMTVKVGTEGLRFAVLAVANRPGGVLAVYCECPSDKRGYWLGEFKALLETVRASAK